MLVHVGEVYSYTCVYFLQEVNYHVYCVHAHIIKSYTCTVCVHKSGNTTCRPTVFIEIIKCVSCL